MTIYTFYKIVCNDIKVTQIYVGSTKDLKDRKRIHKYRCNTPDDEGYNTKVYKFIRNNGGWNNWEIIVILQYPCNSRSDAIIKERELYEKLKESNIFARRYFYPLISSFPMYSKYKSSAPDNLIMANLIANQILCLPIYPSLEKHNVERIIQIIRDIH